MDYNAAIMQGPAPLPIAFLDPAFLQCLTTAASIPDFVANFDRLCGAKVGSVLKNVGINQLIDEATGFRDDQLRNFAEHVHELVYTRLPADILRELRQA
jgi:hypothetical protein